MSRFTDPWQSYMNDAEFKALVDMMTAFIAKAQFSPSEMRQAAMVACIRWEQMNGAPRMLYVQEYMRRSQ